MRIQTTRFLSLLCIFALLFGFATTASALTARPGSEFEYQKSVAQWSNLQRAKSAPLALETELCTLALKLAMEQEGYTGEAGYRPNGEVQTSILMENGYSYVEAGCIVLASEKPLASNVLVKEYLKNDANKKVLQYTRYTHTGVNRYYSEADNLYYHAQLFTRPVTFKTEVPQGTPYAYRGMATTGVNVRAGAGTDYPITGGLGKYQPIFVAKIEGDWAKIFWDNSAYAYVHKTYIKKIPDLGAAKTSATVNVRAGAGTEFRVLGKLKRNTAIELVGYAGNWVKIAWETGHAYIALDYVKQ